MSTANMENKKHYSKNNFAILKEQPYQKKIFQSFITTVPKSIFNNLEKTPIDFFLWKNSIPKIKDETLNDYEE